MKRSIFIFISLFLAGIRTLPAQDALPMVTLKTCKVVDQKICPQLNDPGFLCYDDARHVLYVTNEGDDNILVFSDSLEYVRTIGRFGQGPGEFEGISAVSVAPDGRLVVTDRGRVQVLSSEGEYLTGFRVQLRSPGFPISSCLDSQGRILVPFIKEDSLIQVYDVEGKLIGTFGETSEIEAPYEGHPFPKQVSDNNVYLKLDKQDNIYVAFYNQPIVRKYDSDFNLVWECMLDNLAEIKELKYHIKDRWKQAKGQYGHLILNGFIQSFCMDDNYLYFQVPAVKYPVFVLDKITGTLICKYRLLDTSSTHYWIESFTANKNSFFISDSNILLLSLKITGGEL